MADRTSLSRATESSDAPTPGYLYLDIARAASSSPIACHDTVQYLLRRLQTKQQPSIKYKCLKVLQKTVESPMTRGMCQRTIVQDPKAIAAIKEALQCRGPPDPLRGDSMYEKVRTAAKECLEAVYADAGGGGHGMEIGGSSMNAGLAGGMGSSYGNSVAARSGGGNGGGGFGGAPMGGYPPGATGMSGAGGGMSGGAMGGRKMEGIGNPMFQDPRMEDSQSKGIGRMTITQVASAVGSTVKGMIKDPLARNAVPSHSLPSVTVHHNPSHRIGNLPGYGGSTPNAHHSGSMYGGYGNPPPGNMNGGGGGYSSQPPGARELAQQTGGAWTMASNRGANAIQHQLPHGGTAAHAPSGVGGSWAGAGSTMAPSHGGHVASAIPLTGPSSYHSAGTAASDGTYERNLIAELCPPGGMRPEPPEDKLSKFAQSIPSLNSDLVCPVLLDALEDGQPWIIKAKTLCVIDTTIQSAKEAMGDSNPYADFFHTCAGEIAPLCSHSRPAVREPAKRVLRALGLALPTSSSAATVPVAPPAEAPPPPAPVEVPAPVNLLDFGEEETFGSTPVVDPTPTSVPPEAPPPPPPNVPPPTIPPSVDNDAENVAGASLFGGLTMTPTSSTTTSAPTPAGSAFGFISSDAPTPAAPSASTSVPTPSPPPETELLSLAAPSATVTASAMKVPPSSTTFDPLLSLGHPTSTTTTVPPPPMTMSPSMTYHPQTMLQMQHQLQQMQLAMAHQQAHAPTQAPTHPSHSQTHPQRNMNVNRNVNVMQSHTSYIPDMNMMQPVGTSGGLTGGGGGSPFSILESAKKEEDQKSFDFIKDAMNNAK